MGGTGCLLLFISAILLYLSIAAFVDGMVALGIVLSVLLLFMAAGAVSAFKGDTSGLRRIRSGGRYVNPNNMSGEAFEVYCGKLLLANGYRDVRQTKASNDFGADLVATGPDGERWVFQCKRYAGMVDNSAVQEVVSSKAHYRATMAGIMTNSKLTANARKLAQENGVKIYENIR